MEFRGITWALGLICLCLIGFAPYGSAEAATRPTISSPVSGPTKLSVVKVEGTAALGTTIEVYDASTKIGGPFAVVASGPNSVGRWSGSVSLLGGDGPHLLQAVSSKGGKSDFLTVSVSSKLPAITIKAAAGKHSFSTVIVVTSPTVTVSGSVDTDTQIQLFDGATPIGKSKSISHGSTTWTQTVTFAKGGPHVLTARARDAAGRTAVSAEHVVLQVNTPPPSVVITYPTSHLTDHVSDLAVAGTGDPGATIQLFDGSVPVGDETIVQPDETWNVAIKLDSEGAHWLTAKSTSSGNTSTSTGVLYTLDIPTPTVAISSPASRPTKVATLTLTGTSSGSTGSTIQLHDALAAIGAPVAVAADGSWRATITLVGDGPHMISARESDTGGKSGDSEGVLYTLESAAPTVAITSPDTGTVGKRTTLAVVGTGDTPGATIQIFDGGVPIGKTVLAAPDGAWSAKVTISKDNGVHKLSATATRGGNTGTSPEVDYTLDRTVPAVAFTNATGGWTRKPKLKLMGTSDAGAEITVWDNDKLLPAAAVTVGNDGLWNIDVTLGSDGEHKLTARASKYGNSKPFGSSAVAIYNLKRTAPLIDIDGTVGANGATRSTTEAALSITGTADADTTVWLFDNGKKVAGPFAIKSDGVWQADFTLVGNGDHVLHARVTDFAFNESRSTSRTYALSSPQIPVPQPMPPAPVSVFLDAKVIQPKTTIQTANGPQWGMTIGIHLIAKGAKGKSVTIGTIFSAPGSGTAAIPACNEYRYVDSSGTYAGTQNAPIYIPQDSLDTYIQISIPFYGLCVPPNYGAIQYNLHMATFAVIGGQAWTTIPSHVPIQFWY